MSIAAQLQKYLDGRGVAYDVVPHTRTVRSTDTAAVSDICEDNLAKGVLIRRTDGYLLAIIPASHHVRLNDISAWLRQPVELATETEVASVFGDCDVGAIPPIAGAYRLSGVADDTLEGLNDIFFEGGDHQTLVHMTGRAFHQLMADVPHARISTPNH